MPPKVTIDRGPLVTVARCRGGTLRRACSCPRTICDPPRLGSVLRDAEWTPPRAASRRQVPPLPPSYLQLEYLLS